MRFLKKLYSKFECILVINMPMQCIHEENTKAESHTDYNIIVSNLMS